MTVESTFIVRPADRAGGRRATAADGGQRDA